MPDNDIPKIMTEISDDLTVLKRHYKSDNESVKTHLKRHYKSDIESIKTKLDRLSAHFGIDQFG